MAEHLNTHFGSRLWTLILLISVASSSTAISAGNQPPQARFSAATLQRGIEAFLREYISDSDEITFLAPIEEVRFDRHSVVAYCRLPNNQPVGRTEVEVSFQADGQEIKRLRVPVLVAAKRMVAVAVRNLRRGENIGSDDVRFELRDVTRLLHLLPDTVVGMRLTQSVSAGTVLLRSMVSGNCTVQSGEAVTLLLLSGAITIRTAAQTLHSASCGESVKVRRKDTGAVLVGTLTDSKTIVVDLGTQSSTTTITTTP